ncbi:MAG: hypothetical protein AAFO57_11510 [Pseudomonadota bacterium]
MYTQAATAQPVPATTAVFPVEPDAFEAEAPVNAKTAPTVIAPANDNDQPRANILAKRGRRWARLRNRR